MLKLRFQNLLLASLTYAVTGFSDLLHLPQHLVVMLKHMNRFLHISQPEIG